MNLKCQLELTWLEADQEIPREHALLFFVTAADPDIVYSGFYIDGKFRLLGQEFSIPVLAGTKVTRFAYVGEDILPKNCKEAGNGWVSVDDSDQRYAAMDYSDWLDTFHAELQDDLRKQYDEYCKMMESHGRTDEVYIVAFQYDDVGGMLDEMTINYSDREQAIKAAVRESKRPGNYGVKLRHEWYDNEFKRDEGEWIDWEKEVKDGQAV